VLNLLTSIFPIRFLAFAACIVATLLGLSVWASGGALVWALVPGSLVGIGLLDLMQTKRSILRNYPVIGHLRFMLEFIRPEIRQYFIESDNEATPFSRAQRSLVYQRAKGDSDKRPFGTQLDVHSYGHEWMTHSIAPSQIASHDFRITIGPNTAQPYSASVFNISAMSFGALSANAILSLNAGAKRGGFAHDTGEGSISIHHRKHGGDLIWEVGSGYFGCRNDDGTFNAEKFTTNARHPQVKMIEVKLSQGAKPGHGGVLVTRGNGLRLPKPWFKPALRRTLLWLMEQKAEPARPLWNSLTTWARRCKKVWFWCTTPCAVLVFATASKLAALAK
jgi:glutamate synthase domain-containing protein 2